MIKLKETIKLYELFLTFSSIFNIKDLNLLSEYYKEKLESWGSKKIICKIYFLNSKYNTILGEKKQIIFCLKIMFYLNPYNIILFHNLIKLNSKLKKFLILSKKSYGSTKKTSIKKKK